MDEKKTIETPAKQFHFKLDPFQVEAIKCLEERRSVLVSAHTSAGKTAVAEYAIAMALRDVQRVIYTSPIKALSNQKYRELYEEFHDVGLMTGDATINPSASCLVMTTEVLRNMLYRGSEIIREVAWVIFDEIHYLRDRERGVVWEETIVLLPDKVRFVFLSATIPNASEFANWVKEVHKQPVDVIYTDFRPVPLHHYVFPCGGEGLYLVIDERGTLREDNLNTALTKLSTIQETRHNNKKQTNKRKRESIYQINTNNEQSDIYKVVRMIMARGYNPAIVFSFSKKDCETHALNLSKLDFTTDKEKQLIQQIFTAAIRSLSAEDKILPQVENILPILKRGIGIHHSGLLPILKEVIEILFQEGLIKTLFSTETFSLGINMPAKTVLFTGIRKFDGSLFRVITSGEYIQMSGRAGRRGTDDRGIVILMLDGLVEYQSVKNILCGDPDSLLSSFHLGYNMLENLLRVEDSNPEFMMSRSFLQFQTKTRNQLKETLKSNQQYNQIENMKMTLKNMKRVLRRLDHITSDNVITQKGRVACDISIADELLTTEIMFGGLFQDLEIENLVALLSCLICTEKMKEKKIFNKELLAPFRKLRETARRIAQVQDECKIPISIQDYTDQFKPNLIEIVYLWMKGAKFSEICEKTDIFEGNIIRMMRRLEELLRELADASKMIGNNDLEHKFLNGITKIKRDIIFAASLYL